MSHSGDSCTFCQSGRDLKPGKDCFACHRYNTGNTMIHDGKSCIHCNDGRRMNGSSCFACHRTNPNYSSISAGNNNKSLRSSSSSRSVFYFTPLVFLPFLFLIIWFIVKRRRRAFTETTIVHKITPIQPVRVFSSAPTVATTPAQVFTPQQHQAPLPQQQIHPQQQTFAPPPTNCVHCSTWGPVHNGQTCIFCKRAFFNAGVV
jgi:hypothetical protein